MSCFAIIDSKRPWKNSYGKYFATNILMRIELSETQTELIDNPNKNYPLDRTYDSDTNKREIEHCVLNNIPIGQRPRLNYDYGTHALRAIKQLCLDRPVQAQQIPLIHNNYCNTTINDILDFY